MTLCHAFFGTRMVLLLMTSVTAFVSLYIFYFNTKFEVTKIFEFFFPLFIFTSSSIAMTFYTSQIVKFDFSYWQIFRSHIYTLIAPITGFLCYSWASNTTDRVRKYCVDAAEIWITLAAFLLILGTLTNFTFVPAKIMSDDNTRIYVVGDIIAISFLPILILRKRYFAIFASLVVVGFTGGKILILSWMLFFFYTFLNHGNRKFYSKLLTSLSIIIITIPILYFLLSDRVLSFIENGDSFRYAQAVFALNLIAENVLFVSFGIGLGTAFWNGFALFGDVATNDASKQALFENIRYDTEIGYIYLLLRLGIIGAFVYFFMLMRMFKGYKLYFITFIFISFLGSAPSGFNYFFSMFIFGIAAACYEVFKKTS